MRSIAWLSEKGGTGKTTSAINCAVGLARAGGRVLLVDADPQGNATLVLSKGQGAGPVGLAHVLMEEAEAEGAIVPTEWPALDLLPGDHLLAEVNVSLAEAVGRESRLRRALAAVGPQYDYVLVDTSPQRSILNVNVLNYVTEVICPVDPGVFSLAGLGKLQGVIAEVVKYLDNAALHLAGLVLTRAARDNLSRDVEARLRETFGALVFDQTIPGSAKIGEAHARFLSVLDYAPRSAGAVAYSNLVQEVIHRGKINGGAGGIELGTVAADDSRTGGGGGANGGAGADQSGPDAPAAGPAGPGAGRRKHVG